MVDFIEKIADLFDPFSGLIKIAGIGGASIILIYLIVKAVLKKAEFQKLTRNHTYKILRLIVICCTVIGCLGIFVYGFLKDSQESKQQKTEISDTIKYQPLILKSQDVILIDSSANKK